MNTLVLKFDNSGTAHCLYSELIDLNRLGALKVRRASNIEFNASRQEWEVRGGSGRVLHSNRSRSVCLTWEQNHFNR